MNKNTNEIPVRFLDLIRPLLISNEKIVASYRESFNWESFYRRWLVLTNYRLFVMSRALTGAKSEEYHLKEMDIDLTRDNFGPYDSVKFMQKDALLYELAVFRTRRRVAQEFLREMSRYIAERELTPDLKRDSDMDNNSDWTACLSDIEIHHLHDLEKMGAISNEEFLRESQRACKNRPQNKK